MIASDVMQQMKVVCGVPASASAEQMTAASLGTGHGNETQSLVASDRQRHGFKHFMERVGYYAGQRIIGAATLAGYAAMGIAMSAD